MAKILVSVPVLGRPSLSMIKTLYSAIHSCKEHDITIHFSENDSMISRVRNVHVSTFINDYEEYDYFMSIDSDLEIVNRFWNNNIFTKLLEHDKEFVGGLYALKREGPPIASSVPLDRDRSPKFNSGLKKMLWLSTGCWCLKRSAINKMIEAYPELIYDGDDNMVNKKIYGLYIPMLKNMDVGGKKIKKYLSEDWSFPVHPDTNVLCDNFLVKAIKNVEVGDTIISFEEYPSLQKRKLVKSVVKNKFFKKLPTIKIETEDGEEIITTKDHEWLIKRSWRKKSRGSAKDQRLQSPCKSIWAKTEELKIGDSIYKPFENINNEDLIFDRDYMTGYLSGVWDGDGWISKHKTWNSHNIGVGLTDDDILSRIEKLLREFNISFSRKDGVNIKSAGFKEGKHKQLNSIRILGSSNKDFLSIYNSDPKSLNYYKGYLSGIFDAEGHYDGATVDISQYENVSPEIYDTICSGLSYLELSFKKEKKRIRLTGCRNVHKFFMLTTPACKRKLHLAGQKKGLGSLLMPQNKVKISNISPVGENDDVICITTSSGTFVANGFASHNCSRWRDIGGEIFADTSIVLKHYGEKAFNLWNTEVVVKEASNEPITKPVNEPIIKPEITSIGPPLAGFDLNNFTLGEQ